MNIIEKLRNQNIHTQIKYYGLNDMSTGISISGFLDGKKIILENYIDFKINDIESYIDYVYLEHILKFEEAIPYIIENKRNEFQIFINDCKLLFEKYAKKDFIKYILNNYRKIFEYKNDDMISCLEFDLKEYTIINIANYSKNINDELIDYLIDNQLYSLIDNFEYWQSYFKKNPIKFVKLFSKENIEKVFYMRYQSIFDILVIFSNNDNFKDKIREISESIFDIISERFFGIEDDNLIWESYYTLNDCLCFFRKIKSSKTNKIEDELNIQRDIFEDSVMKNGQTTSFKIDLEPFKIGFENKNIPWEIRIISVTHTRDKAGNLNSFIDNAINNESGRLFDIMSRKNPGTNEYFTNSRLRNLKIYTFEIKGRMDIILSSRENIKEYIDSIYEEIKYVCKNLKVDYNNEEFNNDIEMLYYYLIDIKNINKENIISLKNMYYGLSMFLCGFIEKILRIIYKNSISSDIYIADKNIMLGNLLDNEEIIHKIIGINQSRCLRYLLTKVDYDTNVGLNIRNDLAHLNGRTMKALNYDMVLELLSYFTAVVNTACLYYNNLNIKKGSEK